MIKINSGYCHGNAQRRLCGCSCRSHKLFFITSEKFMLGVLEYKKNNMYHSINKFPSINMVHCITQQVPPFACWERERERERERESQSTVLSIYNTKFQPLCRMLLMFHSACLSFVPSHPISLLSPVTVLWFHAVRKSNKKDYFFFWTKRNNYSWSPTPTSKE